ncbi:MAG: hypothetical protein K2Q23_06605 [Bryobacteraceae bacterium]|nr:hypothetical protein [Bryobacteraceae bacterium]
MLSFSEFAALLAAEPLLLEPGAEPMRLKRGQVEIHERRGLLELYAWDAERSTTLAVAKVEQRARGRWELTTRGLFGRERRLELIDPERADLQHRKLRAIRDRYREQLRRSLLRQFPGWRIAELTTGADLEHSLSPAYARAVVEKGARRWAALLAPPMSAPDPALSFALIWHDYLRRRHREPRAVEGLAIFLPLDQHIPTALRLKHLDTGLFEPALFAYEADGGENPVELRDTGNWIRALERPWRQGDDWTPVDTPEGRLEVAVRRDLSAVDAALLEPVYGQVPAFAAQDRDLIDLLAADRAGRLAVIELKAEEDLHLPLQGLDYWLRVHYHLHEQTFAARGYFPGRRLSPLAPRLYFVAPALRFHPSNRSVLRYFSPAIEVERVGVAERWDQGLRVVSREGRKREDEHPDASSTSDFAPQPLRGARQRQSPLPHRPLRRA